MIETGVTAWPSACVNDIKSKFHENKDWNLGRVWLWEHPGRHQEQVPRKQGLKLVQCTTADRVIGHQEQVPRKQGLKQQGKAPTAQEIADIKSKFHENKDWNRSWPNLISWSPSHQEQVPRKQGLKQHIWIFVCRNGLSSRASSTKTRIETTTGLVTKYGVKYHQEQVPRKQGLKPDFHIPGGSKIACHQEQVPRKQGLKHAKQEAYIKSHPGASRASSTKTRIETYKDSSWFRLRLDIKSKFHENKDWNIRSRRWPRWPPNHQEQVPRKQGLKPRMQKDATTARAGIKSKFHENKDWNAAKKIGPYLTKKASRASSTKTRIETCGQTGRNIQPAGWASRASSTKTRIETGWGVRCSPKLESHQEQVPRKQGLKLNVAISDPPAIVHQEQVPRKQGLKHLKACKAFGALDHQEQVPRKQGLKPPNSAVVVIMTRWASRASSTKTRIETSRSMAFQ